MFMILIGGRTYARFAPRRTRLNVTRFLVATTAPVLVTCVAGLTAILNGAGEAAHIRRKGKSGTKLRKQADDGKDDDISWRAVTPSEKLAYLFDCELTSAEIAFATGSSVRTIEDRRARLQMEVSGNRQSPNRTQKLDLAIDNLFSIVALLEHRKITPGNIRAWLAGRTMYLEEQRPAALLSTGEHDWYELVREAALAYATAETPREFLKRKGPLPRLVAPAGSL